MSTDRAVPSLDTPTGEPLIGEGDPATDILHLDMDCFFAAVEVLEDPTLLGRPVIVGGTGIRGVVASASYEARAFGVRAAMPTGEARRLCPGGVFLSPRHELYGATSRQLLDLLQRVTPSVEPIALDEAFLDVSGAHRLFGDSRNIAERLRNEVADELHLSCSVGVARSKFLAKLASKAAKPKVSRGELTAGDGVIVVTADHELEFLYAHGVRALPGVGPRTAERLRSLGIGSVADLAAVGRDRLVAHFGRLQGLALADLALGIDRRVVEPERETKSIGQEETFAVDLRDPDVLASYAREFASAVAARARSHELVGRTVTLKVRFADFTMLTRAHTFDRANAAASELANAAARLLREVDVGIGVRLLGVHLSNLQPATRTNPEQLALFGDDGAPPSAREDDGRVQRGGLDCAADEIRSRFGERAIGTLAATARRSVRQRSGVQASAADSRPGAPSQPIARRDDRES